MQMHMTRLRPAKPDHHAPLSRNAQEQSTETSDSATGIAAIWLIFYLGIGAIMTGAGNVAVKAIHDVVTLPAPVMMAWRSDMPVARRPLK